MAYMSQERKAALAPAIKAICKKYGVKATISVRHHSTLSLNIKGGKIDFIEEYIGKVRHAHLDQSQVDNLRQYRAIQVNTYHYKNHFDGESYHFLSEVIPAMMTGNHDNSDIQTDYFDVGWYIDVNVGQWNKPYILENS